MEPMNLGVHIKKLRAQLGYSQEDLAKRVFVSRQTISNWENAKSYPDITSLILLSKSFEVSIDQLVEGDYEIMKQTIEKADINNMKRYWVLLAICLVSGVILLLISAYMGSMVGVVLSLAVSIVGLMLLTYRIGVIRRQYDIHTYREIIAFMNGETLDQIALARESGKRAYQTGLIITVCLALDIIVILAVYAMLKANGLV
jgi:transcriptional regulator with XRE-family HTH domain